ncbi:Aldh1a3 [Symbiodinium natans]|uniref:Aldh1a3 protein n=1 Tax=Symbiodinium natans TaxID=878477 RepID=A0A812UWB2_9DINO|nr:Aldh1a3 [Symbiodinium natans]
MMLLMLGPMPGSQMDAKVLPHVYEYRGPHRRSITSINGGLDLVGVAPNASKEMIEAAAAAASRAAPGWAALRHTERAAMLQSCADALRANLEALATLQTNESGRPLAETRLEVIVAAASFENAARFLDISQERLISEDEEKKVVIRRMPVGVVAVIAPWNAPIVLGWKPTATALACGNPVVLKPAPQTPLTTLRIGELLRPLLPRGVLNVVVGSDLSNPKPGEILTNHELVRKVVFTGSTAIGSKVMEACAKGFKRLLLELGGNDPAIVREDCDVEKAAEGLFKGAFFNNGQTCCAAKRIYVQEKIYDKFVKAFVARARRAVLGNGLSSGTELGPLASAVQLRHVMELVEDARRKGGRVLCGGGATAGPPGDEGSNTGLFYLPTIVVDVAEGTRLVDEEQFGPVVPVMSYKDDEEAVQRANATRYGLSASIWSEDLDTANEIANRLKAGTVWVNKHCEFIRNAPFGGIDESGIGRAGDLGEQDLNQYTEIRTLCLAKAPPKLPPDVESLQPTPEVVVEERARSMLQRIFRRVRSQDSVESAAKEALRVFPFQPLNLRSALASLSAPTGSASVLVRGLPVETPTARRRIESEASLLGVLGLLEASTYFLGDEDPNVFVHEVDQASEAAAWHRDGRSSPSFDAPRRIFRPEKSVPSFALSICVGREGVRGSFVDFRRLRAVADPQDVALLQKEPIAFFDSQLGLRSERVLVAAAQEEDFDVTRKGRGCIAVVLNDGGAIDAAQKRVESAEASQKEALAKQSEIQKLNAELEALTKNSDARNERAKALAQAELVNMAKVWRAERAVEQCRGIKEVSQARLEFWRDAHDTAVVKTKDTSDNHLHVSKFREYAVQEATTAAAAEEAARQRLAEAEAEQNAQEPESPSIPPTGKCCTRAMLCNCGS